MEAVPASGVATPPTTDVRLADRLREYADGEQDRVRAIRDRLRGLRERGRAVAVWGMATKGIMFSLMVDPDSTMLDYAVDVNVNKQGCYVPISGRRIDAPSILQQAGEVAIVVMNPNYVNEIVAACDELGVAASYLDATGVELEHA